MPTAKESNINQHKDLEIEREKYSMLHDHCANNSGSPDIIKKGTDKPIDKTHNSRSLCKIKKIALCRTANLLSRVPSLELKNHNRKNQ